jgi:hypothetical protein
MALGAPYTVCGAGAAAGFSALQVTVTASTAAGQAIVVAAGGGGGSGNPAPTGVTDSQSNTYVQAVLDINRVPSAGIWVAVNTVPLLTSRSDWIQAAYAGTTGAGAKNLIARACAGVMTANAVDIAISNDAGSGTAVSSGSSGGLAQSAEWAVAVISNAGTGGVPGSWTGGFTPLPSQGTGPYLTLADQVVSSQAALTAGAVIATARWECLLVTLQAAVPPPPVIQPPLSAAVHRASWW